MELAILAMETSTQSIFPTPEQKFIICSAVGEKLHHAPGNRLAYHFAFPVLRAQLRQFVDIEVGDSAFLLHDQHGSSLQQPCDPL